MNLVSGVGDESFGSVDSASVAEEPPKRGLSSAWGCGSGGVAGSANTASPGGAAPQDISWLEDGSGW